MAVYMEIFHTFVIQLCDEEVHGLLPAGWCHVPNDFGRHVHRIEPRLIFLSGATWRGKCTGTNQFAEWQANIRQEIDPVDPDMLVRTFLNMEHGVQACLDANFQYMVWHQILL